MATRISAFPAPSLDRRVQDLERSAAEALRLLRSPHAPDRRHARARLAELTDEAVATADQASALITRAMTAAGHAANALRADEQGDAA